MVGNNNDAILWRPKPEVLAHSTLSAFIQRHGIADYAALQVRANGDPAWLWDAVLRFFDVRFEHPYSHILDTHHGIERPRWCVDGTTNLVSNALDRRRGTAAWSREALVWEGETGDVRRVTYAQLHAECCRLAGALRALGVGRGDVVALYMPMLPEVAAAFFAVAKIGAIVMPLFSGFGPRPLRDRLNHGNAKAVITADCGWRRGTRLAMKATLDEAAADAPALRHIIVLQRDGDAPMQRGRDAWWQDIVANQPDDWPTPPLPAETPVMLMYTSGTTGAAKGTVHTHCGVIGKNLLDVGLCLDLQAGERLLWMSDMGWVAGPKVVMSAALLGATLVMAEGTPDYPDAARQWRLIEQHRVTLLGTVPTAVRQAMRGGTAPVARHDLSSLRGVVTAGEPWDREAWLWCFNHICGRRVPILNYGGGTECGGANLIGTLHTALKPCAFGGPVPGSGADIVDAEGKPCAPGHIGELVLRNPSIGLTRGLWRDNEHSEHFLDSYWRQCPGVWTQGDLALRDADGQWFMLGRSDDTIKIAGKRTGPAEIESVIMETGLVSEAAVIGIADALTGQALTCVCIAPPGVHDEAELCAAITGQVVKSFGAPYRPRHVLLVPALPKTRNQKIMRRLLRSVICGEAMPNLDALANPECLEALRAAANA